jgi:hypothetical protein
MISLALSEIGLALLFLASPPLSPDSLGSPDAPDAPDALGPLRPFSGLAPSGGEDFPLFPEDDRGGLVLGVHHIPVLSLRADEDGGEYGGGIEFWADPAAGSGYGIDVGWREGPVGFGLLYLTSEHEERITRAPCRMHGAFLELRVHGEQDFGFAEGTVTLAGGLGFAGVEFDHSFDDSGGTALGARITWGLRFGGHLGLEMGGGYFEWGVPGETIGDGSYMTLGLTWHP